MKIATANRIDEFWKESKGVLLPKSNVLNTLEEIEANTDVENIAGATALKEVNNNLMFPDGTKFYPDIKDGERGFNTDPARGADTFIPFSSAESIHILSADGTYKNLTLSFENPHKKEVIACFGYVQGNSAQYFMYDFLRSNGYEISSISKTDTTITLVRPVTATSTCTYRAWVVLA